MTLTEARWPLRNRWWLEPGASEERGGRFQFLEQEEGCDYCKDGKVEVRGVNPALTRFTSSSFVGLVRSHLTLTEWRMSPVKVLNSLDALVQ